MTIPASQIVNVQPNVISAGGSALDLIGLCLTQNTKAPIGTVLPFGSSLAVANYFGASSNEATAAAVYFSGFDGSAVKPAQLLFAQYPATAVAAWLRSGSVSGRTLAQLQALSGVLTVTVAGVANTSGSINLSAATSFSNAATIIQAAFTAPAFAVTYDAISSQFVFTSTATGTAATITYATGTLSTGLLLTQVTGATVSQGAAAVTDPAAFMSSLTAITQNWASFFTLFNPDVSGNTNKVSLATWTSQQNNRYLYLCVDSDAQATQLPASGTLLSTLLQAAGNSGTALIYDPGTNYYHAFLAGAIASIDFTQYQGRTDLAFKSQPGLLPTVTDLSVAQALDSNGYNYYESVATANQGFIFNYRGVVTGKFKFIDSYINQIWLNNGLQLAAMLLLTSAKSVPYNDRGYSLLRAALLDPIQAAVNFGAIQPGVPLSNLQIASINNAAGLQVDKTLSSVGWYLQIRPAAPATRAQRKSPPINLWYTDGQSIQQINLNSYEVQ